MPAIICPHCGVTNRAFSNFCNNCGADLRDERIAPDERTVDPHGALDHSQDPFANIAPRLRQDRDDDAAGNGEEPDLPTTKSQEDSISSKNRGDSKPDELQSTDTDANSDVVEYAESFESLLPSDTDSVNELPADQIDGQLNNASDQPELDDQASTLPNNRVVKPQEGISDSDGPISTGDASKPEQPSREDTQTAEQIVTDRLVSGIQGALRPHPLIHELLRSTDDDDAALAESPPTTGKEEADALWHTIQQPTPAPSLQNSASFLDSLEREDIQNTMRFGASLENELLPIGLGQSNTLHIPAIFWLLLGGLFMVVAFNFSSPGGEVRSLPGVADGLAIVESLTNESNVLVYWAYDPATAGEMDLVVQPILQHLIDKEVQIATISSLPAGPATARRLWLELTDQYPDTHSAGLIDLGYLPGGATSMPLLAYTDILGILRYGIREYGAGTALETFWQSKPDMMLIVAAQAEDVQLWLEQVQPLNDVPTLAVTSAAAGPVARIYWDSRQLSGLVSGFDGSALYQSQTAQTLSDSQQMDSAFLFTTLDNQARHLVAQNWGQLIFLFVIVLGNLAHLFGSRQS